MPSPDMDWNELLDGLRTASRKRARAMEEAKQAEHAIEVAESNKTRAEEAVREYSRERGEWLRAIDAKAVR